MWLFVWIAFVFVTVVCSDPECSSAQIWPRENGNDTQGEISFVVSAFPARTFGYSVLKLESQSTAIRISLFDERTAEWRDWVGFREVFDGPLSLSLHRNGNDTASFASAALSVHSGTLRFRDGPFSADVDECRRTDDVTACCVANVTAKQTSALETCTQFATETVVLGRRNETIAEFEASFHLSPHIARLRVLRSNGSVSYVFGLLEREPALFVSDRDPFSTLEVPLDARETQLDFKLVLDGVLYPVTVASLNRSHGRWLWKYEEATRTRPCLNWTEFAGNFPLSATAYSQACCSKFESERVEL